MDLIKNLPDNTLVLAITTHGAIPDEDGNVSMFKVPDGMTITKFSVSPIGVCNMASEDDSTEMVNTIAGVFRDPNIPTFEEKMKTAITKLKELQKGILSQVVKNTTGQPKDILISDFLNYSDRSLTVETYTAGEEMINKDYVKQPGEGQSHPYDFKMPILNIEGKHDLLQLLASGRLGIPTRSMNMNKEMTIDLSSIASILQTYMDVTHLVLFDYSCSTFYEMDPYTKRLAARNLMKEGQNGGRKKTRRRKNKTKTRKSKKRTVSRWKH